MLHRGHRPACRPPGADTCLHQAEAGREDTEVTEKSFFIIRAKDVTQRPQKSFAKELFGKLMNKYVCVVGGINLDIKGVAESGNITSDSHPGKIIFTPGGVARNISENLARLGMPVYLFGCAGNDLQGELILAETKKAGVNVQYVLKSDLCSTAKYLSVSNSHGDLSYAVNDMKDSLSLITADYISSNSEILESAGFIVLDTNLSQDVLQFVINFANKNNIPVFVDTVSSAKAVVIKGLRGAIDYLSPNIHEYESLFGKTTDNKAKLRLIQNGVFRNYKYIIVKKGKEGIDIIDVENSNVSSVKGLKPDVREPNGAGDAFNAGFIFGLIEDYDVVESSKIGICAAYYTLMSENSVSNEITRQKVLDLYKQKL